ncbi:MAG: hypothetical protein KKF56_05155 [Nanoarchaeota archaeon]|nr:hypothetical protein [Nanoarchaeota archaeon]
MRKGYASELIAKHQLINEFGKDNVTKIAIGSQGADFMVICCGEVIKVVEVKECHQKNYYPNKRELEQFERIRTFAKIQGIMAELWIYKYLGRGKPKVKITKYLYHPHEINN